MARFGPPLGPTTTFPVAFDVLRATATRIAPERLLDLKRQPVHAAAHVGHAGDDPDPEGTGIIAAPERQGHGRARWDRRWRRRRRSCLARARSPSGPRPAWEMRRVSRGRLGGLWNQYRRHEACGRLLRRSGRNSRRHRVSNEREIPCRRAVADTRRGPARLSRTTRSFSSSDQRRRRPISTNSSREAETLSL